MAKIGNLEVDTLNMAFFAIHGIAVGTGQVVAANSANLPVQVFWTGLFEIITSSQNSASIDFRLTRSRGSLLIYNRTGSWGGGSSSGEFTVNCAYLDHDAQAGDTYNWTPSIQTSHTPGSSGPIVHVSGIGIAAIWAKK